MVSETSYTSVATANGLDHSWVRDVDLSTIVEQVGTPVFVYSAKQLSRNIDRIKSAARTVGLDDRVELYIPFFPNANPHVLEPLRELGVGILLQLPGEYSIMRKFGFDKFIVSPGYVSNEEIGFWQRTGYPTFLSSLGEVSHALRANAPTISVRIDSLDSGKPGIKSCELNELADLLARHQRELECLEVYCGSGNSLEDMVAAVEQLFTIFTTYFPHARSVNFAGGQGFVYEDRDEREKHFDWPQYFRELRRLADEKNIPDHVKFLFEPARDVLADTGALLLGVKRDPIITSVAGILVTDGSRMLMPSAQLRQRQHNIAFLDASMAEIHPEGADAGVDVGLRGRSILRHDYILPGEYRVPRGIDSQSYVVILDVGAYCATQHMEFLNIPPAAEVQVDTDGAMHLVTSRGDDLDRWRHLLPEKEELKP